MFNWLVFMQLEGRVGGPVDQTSSLSRSSDSRGADSADGALAHMQNHVLECIQCFRSDYKAVACGELFGGPQSRVCALCHDLLVCFSDPDCGPNASP